MSGPPTVCSVQVEASLLAAIRAGTGRPTLKRQFNLSENDARFYGMLVKRADAHPPPAPRYPYCALILADLHIPYHVQDALTTVLAAAQSLPITHLVLLGDIIDNQDMSFWPHPPGIKAYRQDIEDTRKTLDVIAAAFPAVSKKYYVMGNHEHWLPQYLWKKSPELYGLHELTIPALLRLAETGWETIDNGERISAKQGAFQLGGVALLHGHELKVNYGGVNIPRLYYLKVRRPCIVGHHHKTDMFYPRLLDHTYDQAHSVACLCDLSPSYSRLNDWNWGFCLLSWNEDGAYRIENKRLLPDGIV